MHIYDAKFQEDCFNRDIVYLVFSTFELQTVWRHHWSNLHNRKMSISLKRKKIFQKEKRHSSVFWKAFQISTKKFHRHFNPPIARKRITWSKVLIWCIYPLETSACFGCPIMINARFYARDAGLSFVQTYYTSNTLKACGIKTRRI